MITDWRTQQFGRSLGVDLAMLAVVLVVGRAGLDAEAAGDDGDERPVHRLAHDVGQVGTGGAHQRAGDDQQVVAQQEALGPGGARGARPDPAGPAPGDVPHRVGWLPRTTHCCPPHRVARRRTWRCAPVRGRGRHGVLPGGRAGDAGDGRPSATLRATARSAPRSTLGVGDQKVVDPGGGQVAGLGGGEREHALPAGHRQHPAQHLDAPDRLRRHPDRQPAGLRHQGSGVGLQGVQVDHGERGVPVADRGLQPLVGSLGGHGAPRRAAGGPSTWARWSLVKTPTGSSRSRTAWNRSHPA